MTTRRSEQTSPSRPPGQVGHPSSRPSCLTADTLCQPGLQQSIAGRTGGVQLAYKACTTFAAGSGAQVREYHAHQASEAPALSTAPLQPMPAYRPGLEEPALHAAAAAAPQASSFYSAGPQGSAAAPAAEMAAACEVPPAYYGLERAQPAGSMVPAQFGIPGEQPVMAAAPGPQPAPYGIQQPPAQPAAYGMHAPPYAPHSAWELPANYPQQLQPESPAR